jgi:hypothetical protein
LIASTSARSFANFSSRSAIAASRSANAVFSAVFSIRSSSTVTHSPDHDRDPVSIRFAGGLNGYCPGVTALFCV